MARIFNIYFTYEGTQFNAIVSVRTTPFFIEYTLNNINDSLLEVLPGNKIISKGSNHFSFQNASHENSTELMEAIIHAVAEHLHATQAGS